MIFHQINLTWGFWDYLLLVGISIQATILAYCAHPRWKAFVLSLPLPFSLTFLAVGKPVDASNVLALLLLLAFNHGVRAMYRHLRIPIVLSIILSQLAFCVIGALALPFIPEGDFAFFLACGLITGLAVIMILTQSHSEEPSHQSPLPVWSKLLLIMIVVGTLILIKQSLQGLMTAMPMVGTIAAYEARHCLRTICRQIPVIMLGLLSMMITVRFLQPHIGILSALALAWLAFALVFTFANRLVHRKATPSLRKTDTVNRQQGICAERSCS